MQCYLHAIKEFTSFCTDVTCYDPILKAMSKCSKVINIYLYFISLYLAINVTKYKERLLPPPQSVQLFQFTVSCKTPLASIICQTLESIRIRSSSLDPAHQYTLNEN